MSTGHVVGPERRVNRLTNLTRAPQCLEERAEPLCVRRPAAFEHERQVHHGVHQPRGDDAGACIVTDISRASHQREFLLDANPIAGEHVPPDIVGIPLERPPYCTQFIGSLGEQRAGDDLQCGLP